MASPLAARPVVAMATAMALAVVALPPEGAESAAPRVLCVDAVGNATLDESLPLAGRVRALADTRGRIVARSLSCPYGRDGRLALELEAVWVTRAGGAAAVGPVGCGSDDYVIEPDGASAVLSQAGRQFAVFVNGEARLVRAAERASRLIAAFASNTAVGCRNAESIPAATRSARTGTTGAIAAVAALTVLVGLAVLILRRRSAPQASPASGRASPPVPESAADGLLNRGPVGAGAGLPVRLLALSALADRQARLGVASATPARTERLRRAAATLVKTPPARWRSPAVFDGGHRALDPDPAEDRVRS